MNVETILNAAMDEFKENLHRFCDTLDLSELTPGLAEEMCSGLQQALASAGLAGLKAFLLNYESDADLVRDAAGELYRYKCHRRHTSLTPFGKLTLSRRCYQNKSDSKSYAPLDAAWGMERQFMTPQVREAVLYSSALITPEETAQLLKKCAAFKPHATLIKREIARTGEVLASHRASLDNEVRAVEACPSNTHAFVVSIDGATVLMNEKGVHFGRVAQRPGGNPAGESPTAYRVAMVGSTSYYGAPDAPGEGPVRIEGRYVAHMPERGCPSFKGLLEAEVDHAERSLAADIPRILLLDGARELWNYFDKDPRYDGYHRLIDYWHAVEHLSVAAEALFGSGEKARSWYEKYRHILLEHDDGAERICRSIDYYQPKHGRSRTSEKHLAEERTYFTRNGKRMHYATFRANGWPIGSGPIEAACKTLIKTRFCRSGMRWSREGGQHVLNLRTYIKSGRWEPVWERLKHKDRAA